MNGIVKGYIDETAASISSFVRPLSQISDINTLMAADTRTLGQGGNDINPTPIQFSTIQGSSIIAYAPPSQDYISEGGYKRSQVTEYTVQSGDLVSFIASDYGVSVNSILWANNLKNADSIKPGQVLKIPPVSGVVHKIKKGDTVGSIAKKYGVEADKIIAFNGLPQDGSLQIDVDIVVPDGVVTKPVKTTSTISAGGKVVTSPAGQVTFVASYNPTNNKKFAYLADLGDYFIVPTIGFNWGIIHNRNGVDIANSCGTSIRAAAAGTITTSDATGYNGGFGKYIKIAHDNGTETLYGHASKLLVAVGAYVTRGQEIALMGTTGRSTGCHLHFEVHGARNPLAKY